MLRSLLVREPSQGRDQPPRCLWRGGPHLDDLLNSFRHAALEGQHPGGEGFTGLADVYRIAGLANLPTGVAGDAQAVEMGLDTVVESSQFPEFVVRIAEGTVADKPEKSGFFRVLLDNDRYDCHVTSFNRVPPGGYTTLVLVLPSNDRTSLAPMDHITPFAVLR